MARFHINNKGEPGKCAAVGGGCPFGGPDDHYASTDEAWAAFETSMASENFGSVLTKARLHQERLQARYPESLETIRNISDTITEPFTPAQVQDFLAEAEAAGVDDAKTADWLYARAGRTNSLTMGPEAVNLRSPKLSSLSPNASELAANAERDAYRAEAVAKFEALMQLEQAVLREDYEGDSRDFHREMVGHYNGIIDAAESVRLRTDSTEERAAWNRTATAAEVEKAGHQRMIAHLKPREERGDREARRMELAHVAEKVELAKDALEDVQEDYSNSSGLKFELVHRVYEASGVGRSRADFEAFGTPEDRMRREKDAAFALYVVRESQGNEEIAAMRLQRDWAKHGGYTPKPWSEVSEFEKRDARQVASITRDLLLRGIDG